MKRLLILILTLNISFSTFLKAQQDYTEWLSIGVYMPSQYSTDLGSGQKQRLETKIISVIARNGIGAKVSAFKITVDTSASVSVDLLNLMAKGIVCIPKFEIYNERIADTGMKKLKVVDVDLTLTVQYIYEDVIFSDINVQLQGSGSNRDQALNSAIRGIRTTDSKWKRFLETTHREIIRYYDGMCGKLMDQAEHLNKLNLTSEALSILWPIPKEVSCHAEVEELSLRIYQKHINQQCKRSILNARALLAGNRYDEGLAVLARIDPISDCYEDAVKMIESIEVELDENTEKNRSAFLTLQQQQLEVEKYRYERMMEITAEKNKKQFAEVLSGF